jgi:hypothetical protein
MKRRALAAAVLMLAVANGIAFGQTLNARRTGMGGVLLPGGGPGSDAINVAYHAVPPAPGSASELPLPIGLIPLLADPPTLDPDDADFNVYDLANKLYNPPWNLQLVEPAPPSSDVVVSLGRDYLGVELGEIAGLFPEDRSRFGSVTHLPALGFGVRHFFANVSALAHYQNELRMNDPLYRALAQGAPFRTRTEYALHDDAKGQAAGALQLGWAGAVAGRERAGKGDRSGFYVGARAKVLRGLCYADANNQVVFTTEDTLFSNDPVALDYVGHLRTAGPADGGWGQGFDLGAVWVVRGFEIGVGANDLATRVRWNVEESLARRDSATNEIKSTVVARDVALTSEIPPTYTVTAARRFGGTLIAADAVRGLFVTTFHLGAEHWLGPVAVRAGGSLDADRSLQYAGGLGFRFWRLGVDAGVATHSRNLSHERGVELGAGLALYR